MLFENVPESFDFREARDHITLLFYQIEPLKKWGLTNFAFFKDSLEPKTDLIIEVVLVFSISNFFINMNCQGRKSVSQINQVSTYLLLQSGL